jgi:transposase
MSKTPRQQRGSARTLVPQRTQVEMQLLSLDQWLDAEHRVRSVWQYVESLDLSELYASIKAVEGHVGRDAIDPRMLFALWLFGTLEGVSSARRLAELTTRDIAYLWICGGVSVNHHRLSDFRADHGDLLERILTDSIAVLLHEGLVTLETVAQDGMRVRASAGVGSFRRVSSLEEAQRQAAAHLEEVRRQNDQDGDGGDRRRRAAGERAAREKHERIERARAEMEELQARYAKRSSGTPRSEPRASTTDPEARRMKMADGGFRPALNVQLVSDGDAQLVVTVDVTSQGSDAGLMRSRYDDLGARYGVLPQNYLVDGGFSKQQDVVHVERAGTKVHAPLYAEAKQLAAGADPYAVRPGEGPELTAYRARMGTPEGKAVYRRRAAIAEFPHADCRNRGLLQFRVRGLLKAKAQALWHVLAFNFLRLRRLVCEIRKRTYLEVVMAS